MQNPSPRRLSAVPLQVIMRGFMALEEASGSLGDAQQQPPPGHAAAGTTHVGLRDAVSKLSDSS